ncbi:MAG: hypothetical protein AABW50_01495 [Nanoarchaeota archaeon]
MEKRNWVILIILAVLIILVFLFKDFLIVKNEELVKADYCEQTSDCVLAVNPSSCCVCPMPYNKKVVELEDNLIAYDENVNYLLYDKDADCRNIACEACPQLGNLGCLQNKCLNIIPI